MMNIRVQNVHRVVEARSAEKNSCHAVGFILILSHLQSVTSHPEDSVQTLSVMRDEATVEQVQYTQRR
jgi:hypothetical protein